MTLNPDGTITTANSGRILFDLESLGINFSRSFYRFKIDVSNMAWSSRSGVFSFGISKGTSSTNAQLIAIGSNDVSQTSLRVKITNDGNSLTGANAVNGNILNKRTNINGTFDIFFGRNRAFIVFKDRDNGSETILFDNSITLPQSDIVQLTISGWATTPNLASSLTLNSLSIEKVSAFAFEDFTVKDGRLYLTSSEGDAGIVYANYNVENDYVTPIPQMNTGNFSSISIIDDKMFLTGFNGTTGIWSTPFEYQRDILFTVNKLKGRSGSIDNPTLSVDFLTGLVPEWTSTFIVEDSNLFNDVPLIQIFEKSSGLQVYPSVTVVNNPTETNPELSFKIGIKSDVDIPNGMYQAKVLYI